MSDLDEYWFDPPEGDDPAYPPLPRADRRLLLDPAAWRAAERDCAVDLAQAAQAIGRLDGLLASLDETLCRGLITRLASSEVVSMLWAAGTPIPQEVLIRDLADAPASVDLDALSQARWAIGRLQGRGRLEALRDFLGLHRTGQGRGDSDLLRPTGDDFDDEAEGFGAGLAVLDGCHAITRAAFGCRLWRLTDLSPDGHQLEAMCWAARAMADSADGRIKEGDLVVVNPYLTCGKCRACQIGKPNCCSNIAVLGVHTDGGMCEEIVVPEGNRSLRSLACVRGPSTALRGPWRTIEDMPSPSPRTSPSGAALHEGIRWGWETFPQYMDALAQMPHAIDYLCHVPHDALRVYVMGERAVAEEDATDADIAEITVDCWGILGIDPASRQDQVHGVGGAHQPGQGPADPPLGDQPALGEGSGEHRVRRSEAYVAAERDGHGHPRAGPIDGGDHGLPDGHQVGVMAPKRFIHLGVSRAGLEGVTPRVPPGLTATEILQPLQIGARAEAALHGRVDDERSGAVGSVANVGRQGLELTEGGEADLVGRLPVERDLEDVAPSGPAQGLTHMGPRRHTSPRWPSRSALRSPCGGASGSLSAAHSPG